MNTNDATRPDGLKLALERAAQPPAALFPGSDTSGTWNVPLSRSAADTPAEDAEAQATLSSLVSFHFLRAAIWRRRSFCILMAAMGMVLGVAFLAVAPASHTATTTLVLAHEGGVDPARAMATDVSLLSTRTIADKTIRELDLPIAPAKLLRSLTFEESTSDVLVLTMSAPTDREAVRRLSAFTTNYLTFRAVQVSAQSDALVKGFTDRINGLEQQVAELDKRISTLSASGDNSTERLSETVTARAQVAGQIGALQENVQEVTLRRTAVVSASRVIDPASAEPRSAVSRGLLALMSGLIGGLAIGIGLVVLQAILSDRLRLRVEFAAALEAPVLVSVGSVAPATGLGRLATSVPRIGRAGVERRAEDQRIAARGLVRAVSEGGDKRLAVACLGNADEVRFALARAALDLQRSGQRVQLVDLTADGRLEAAVIALAPAQTDDRPTLVRPDIVPSSDIDPSEFDGGAASMAGHGVRLVLSEVTPRIGLDHLVDWAPRALVAVSGGRTSAQQARTTGDLARDAGLELVGVVLLHSLPDDETSGHVSPSEQAGSRTPATKPSRGAVTA
jgi:capsular polysaccharide biosynthesis protein